MRFRKVTLGDRDDFHLKVVLTNRGAGVHTLTLSKFMAADWYGLPERDANKHPVPLQLIPPADTTSFALYHYPSADKEEPRPLDTLGKRDWQVVETVTEGDDQRVAYATDVPAYAARLEELGGDLRRFVALTVAARDAEDPRATILGAPPPPKSF